mmetsp:Transcript_20748/g.62504  ORF Transcript_20748/g.62504 Transcript_20748/m.62504 type:complete len:176 (-) Transcript_20748:350-877(-)
MSGPPPKQKRASGGPHAREEAAHSKKKRKTKSSASGDTKQLAADGPGPASKGQKDRSGPKAAASVIEGIFGKPKAAAAPAAAQDAVEEPSVRGSGGGKKTGSASAAAAQTAGTSSAEPKMKKGRVAGSKDDLFGSEPVKGRRYDAEGLPIYSTEELAIGKGANTKDCPFDCDCCF